MLETNHGVHVEGVKHARELGLQGVPGSLERGRFPTWLGHGVPMLH